ncbi:hypothetical protein Tco_1226648 [Tanacetum coccineum]
MTESSYRPDTTQVPRDSLEGTDGSKGDQVQSSNDRPHLGGNTSERAKGGLNLLDFYKHIVLLLSQLGEEKCQTRTKFRCLDDLDADLAHGMDYMETEEAVNEGRQSKENEELTEDKGSGEKGGSIVSTARPEVDTARPEVHTANAPVSTAGVTISTVDPEISVVEPRAPPTITSIFDDEDITMAQTLIKMKKEKAKEKGVAFKDVEDSSRHVRSITKLKPLPSIDPKEKGKGILVEEEPVKIKRKDQRIDQIKRDEELAHKLHKEELAEIARIQEEKAAQEAASRVAIMEMFDEVQAGIDADALFTAKLQQEEREEYIIEEREKFLAETIAAQRKFRAAQSAAEIRNDAVKDSKKAAGEDTSKKEEVLKVPDSTKISDLEEEEDLKTFLKIVSDKEGMIDYEVMEKRFPTIKWESKFYHYDRHGAEGIYYRIFRFDGSSRWIKTFFEMMKRFDRLDLVELYNLVIQRFETVTPEGVDLVLWGDLRIMFDANAEDKLYRLMKLEAMMEDRRIFRCWFHHHTTNGHQFTMSNKHQELVGSEQMASGKDFSNPLMADTLPKTIWFSTHDAS